MPHNVYGTVPALAWMLNHYFYGGVHFTWLAEDFHPLRSNPKSSNPYLIYGDLLAAWAHGDEFDKFVAQYRLNLRGGVLAWERNGLLAPALADRLTEVCARAPVAFFYPLVYRVDADAIEPARQTRAGSARHGSRECLVRDLATAEFDLLFDDSAADPDFRRLVLDERSGAARTSPADALATIEARLNP